MYNLSFPTRTNSSKIQPFRKIEQQNQKTKSLIHSQDSALQGFCASYHFIKILQKYKTDHNTVHAL